MSRHESDPSEEETFAPTPEGASAPYATPVDGPRDASGAVRYEIEGLIAEGGMGSVFLARDPALGREVALKVAKGDDPTRRARFLDEMRILGQLEHPNVVPLHALVVSDRAPFCTMRYVRGHTLADVLGGLRGRDPGDGLPLLDHATRAGAPAGHPGDGLRPRPRRRPPRSEAGQRHGRACPAKSRSWTGGWRRCSSAERGRSSPRARITRVWERSSGPRATCPPSRPPPRRWTSGPTSGHSAS